MNIGNLVLLLIILGVIVQLLGAHRRAQRERRAGETRDAIEPSAENGAEDQLPDDEVPEGYVIDERCDDGRIVLRPVTDVKRLDPENVGR